MDSISSHDCFFDPGSLEEIAGVGARSTTGTIELRAMYGGLQAALGALAGAALLRPALERPALVALAFVCGGLFLGNDWPKLFCSPPYWPSSRFLFWF